MNARRIGRAWVMLVTLIAAVLGSTAGAQMPLNASFERKSNEYTTFLWPWQWIRRMGEPGSVTVQRRGDSTKSDSLYLTLKVAQHAPLPCDTSGGCAAALFWMPVGVEKNTRATCGADVIGPPLEVLCWVDDGSDSGRAYFIAPPTGAAVKQWMHIQNDTILLKPTDRYLVLKVGALDATAGSIDHFCLIVDKQCLPHAYVPGWTGHPEDQKWVASNSFRLLSTRPGAWATRDLDSLARLMGRASIVVLGEATHGTVEFSTLKARIIEYLSTKHTSLAVGFEIPVFSGRGLDLFVRGRMDSTEAFRGLSTWNTSEVHEMFRWIQQFNADPKHRNRVRVFGFDHQSPRPAFDSVVAFMHQNDPAFDSSLKQLYFDNSMAWLCHGGHYTSIPASVRAHLVADAEAVVRHMKDARSQYETSTHDPERVMWMTHAAEVVAQGMVYLRAGAANGVRDSIMAGNVEWYEQHEPAQRYVLWMHNMHASRNAAHATDGTDNARMVAFLAARRPADVWVLALTFGDGAYRAGSTIVPADTPPLSSVESILSRVAPALSPGLFVNLRPSGEFPGRRPSDEFPGRRRDFRMAGAEVADYPFAWVAPGDEWDAVAFIKRSSPAVALDRSESTVTVASAHPIRDEIAAHALSLDSLFSNELRGAHLSPALISRVMRARPPRH